MTSAVATPRLRLVGGLYKGSPGETIPFLHQTFGRFPEVKHTGNLTRQVQYASGNSDEDYIHFLGFEVDRVEDIPEGLTAWDIDGDLWSVLEADEVVWQERLSWEWLNQSVPGRLCGEFSARYPEGVIRSFRTMSNGFIGAPCNDEILLVDYDPSWPQKYVEAEKWVKELLGPIALRTEHYGSTAIPGMPAKPIIDVLIEVPSFDEARKVAIPALNTPNVECWCSDHICFYVRDKVTGVRTHHLHMAPAGHRIWEGLAFRDYLRNHPEDADRYSALKYELAERHKTDRSAYTDAKDEFVAEILDKAQARFRE